MHSNIAPSNARRDIAILGSIHRAVLRIGPPQFCDLFRLDPAKSIAADEGMRGIRIN